MNKELEERQALHMIERSLGDHGWFGWEEVETLDNAINELTGMTINEINSYYGDDKPLLSARPNLCKRIRGLYDMGFVNKGIKDVISDTYYITESGLERIKWNGGNKNE